MRDCLGIFRITRYRAYAWLSPVWTKRCRRRTGVWRCRWHFVRCQPQLRRRKLHNRRPQRIDGDPNLHHLHCGCPPSLFASLEADLGWWIALQNPLRPPHHSWRTRILVAWNRDWYLLQLSAAVLDRTSGAGDGDSAVEYLVLTHRGKWFICASIAFATIVIEIRCVPPSGGGIPPWRYPGCDPIRCRPWRLHHTWAWIGIEHYIEMVFVIPWKHDRPIFGHLTQ